jgi:hypothetical protein
MLLLTIVIVTPPGAGDGSLGELPHPPAPIAITAAAALQMALLPRLIGPFQAGLKDPPYTLHVAQVFRPGATLRR